MHLVFGGSFNPPTRAHLHIVRTLHQKFPDATVLILPVGDDYQKPELIPFDHRKEMLCLLFNQDPKVQVLDLEHKRSYLGTLASLNELSKTYTHLHFVIGSDHLATLHHWIRYQTLLASYPIIVMNRNHFMRQEEAERMFDGIEHRFEFVDFDMDISSSDIRDNVEAHKDDLTPEVYQYIRKNALYKELSHV